jgi:uncharacterized phage protein gp47/JayE
MPFSRPTLAQIVDRAKQDLEDKLTGSSPVLRRSVIAVLARVIAGASHLLHGHLDWLYRQLFPTLADETELLRWGAIWAVERKPASFAERDVLFSGSIGAIIPPGAELQRSDGVLYMVDVGGTFVGATLQLKVLAVEAGEAGNVDTGVILSLVTPITSVTNEAPVQAANAIDGADQEDIEAYRERVLFRIANTPQGGTAADHVRWALEVAGVTRAWPFPNFLGLGTMGLAFVRDGDVSIIPDAGEIAQVQDYIDERRPVTEDFTAFAPATLSVPFTIDLLADDTADIRAAVIAELTDLFLREASPGGTILLSHIQEAISIAAGETDHILTTPSANVVAPAGTIAVLGAFTWT